MSDDQCDPFRDGVSGRRFINATPGRHRPQRRGREVGLPPRDAREDIGDMLDCFDF